MEKKFFNLDQQIKSLRKKNLKFKDSAKAKEYLLHHNYYNIINAYSKFFYKTTDVYYDDVYFENILEVYHFDKEIKSIIFDSIIKAERHFKSIVAYKYSEAFKEDLHAYLVKDNYKKKYEIEALQFIYPVLNLIKKKEKEGRTHSNSISHYKTKHNIIPFWIVVDNLTLGQIIKFYKFIPDKIRNNISKELRSFLFENINFTDKSITIDTEFLQTTLENILILRNITAHNNILLGQLLNNNIPYFKPIHDELNIAKKSDKQDIYNTIIMLKLLLTREEYAKLNNTIRKRMLKLQKKIDIVYYKKIVSSLGLPYQLEKIEQIKNDL